MSSNAQIIWNFLKKEGFSDCGAAGLMGNLDAESALKPNNLQNSYNTSLGLSDEEYTKRVDNGTYTNFVYDSAGYGLAQWTYWSRKQNLLNYIKSKGKSIGDLTSQLEFLVKELKENYTNSVYNVLKNTVTPLGHEVFNYGMLGADDKSLTYVQNGLLAGILINSGACDFVVTG